MNPRFACKANRAWSPRISSPLLLGKPVRALIQGEQRDLQQHTLDVVSGYAPPCSPSPCPRRSGFFGSRHRCAGGLFQRRAYRLGTSSHSDTRIGVSQELAGEEGQEVSIEHQFARPLDIEAPTRTKGSSAIDLLCRWPD